jgi:hypothetical protein
MSLREWAEEQLADSNPEALFMDDMDEAIIGVTVGQTSLPQVVVYDEQLIIDELVKGADPDDQEDPVEGAWDHYGFNIQGGYYGENQPLIIRRPEAE